ncbi:hypothetical protein [Dongia sp.]|uniref:hypothetical protein n=1 Tax=Dongia sp. TaxID=1977262 RepID=UPI0035ADDCAB
MDKPRQKQLLYRRATFATKDGQNLEQLLIKAVTTRKSVQDRTFKLADGDMVEGTVTRKDKPSGVVLHVVTYTRNESASVVKHVAAGTLEGSVDTAPPPEDSEYMDREVFAIVRDNDIALCCTNCREGTLESYLRMLLNASGQPNASSDVFLMPVANVEKAKLIQKEGVKSVMFRASLHKQTLAHIDRKRPKGKIVSTIKSTLSAFVKADQSDAAMQEEADLSIALEVKLNRKSGGLAARELNSFALDLLAGDDSDFIIITGKENKIKGDEIALQKGCNLPRKGKSVQRDAAWQALRQYISDLTKGGLVKQ